MKCPLSKVFDFLQSIFLIVAETIMIDICSLGAFHWICADNGIFLIYSYLTITICGNTIPEIAIKAERRWQNNQQICCNAIHHFRLSWV